MNKDRLLCLYKCMARASIPGSHHSQGIQAGIDEGISAGMDELSSQVYLLLYALGPRGLGEVGPEHRHFNSMEELTTGILELGGKLGSLEVGLMSPLEYNTALEAWESSAELKDQGPFEALWKAARILDLTKAGSERPGIFSKLFN